MKQILIASTGLLALMAPAVAEDAAPIEIEAVYSNSGLFGVTFDAIMEEFRKQYPSIQVNFRASYENYEDGTNTVLREAVAGELPDVSMQGLNRQAILVERGIAHSLEPFIEADKTFATDGYHEAMLNLSRFDGEIYGLPFSVSTPIGYYNMDVLAAAGVEAIPTTWEEVVEACGAIAANTDAEPMFWGWSITGNWFLQAMMWSQGERMVEDGEINLDNNAALASLETLKRLVDECGMENYSRNDAIGTFSAGRMGMFFWSTSTVASIERGLAADFDFQTAPFPGFDGPPSALPAGGNAAMLVSQSEDSERLEAAWTFIKFITSGIGAAKVAETTGYVPPNQAANDIILADFYERNPRKRTAVDQLPLLSEWFAYPGDNGLAITQVIHDGLERVVTGDAQDMAALLEEISEEVADLSP